MTDDNLLDEIGRFDQDYQVPERDAIMPNLEALADGVYVFEVVKAELSRTRRTNDPIFRLLLRTIVGPSVGLTVEHVHFFSSQDNIDRLGADLAAMGFDARTWNPAHGKRFSIELTKAMPKMPGIRFQGQKKTNASRDGNKQYHNLYITTCVRGPGEVSSVPSNGKGHGEVSSVSSMVGKNTSEKKSPPPATPSQGEEIPF